MHHLILFILIFLNITFTCFCYINPQDTSPQVGSQNAQYQKYYLKYSSDIFLSSFRVAK